MRDRTETKYNRFLRTAAWIFANLTPFTLVVSVCSPAATAVCFALAGPANAANVQLINRSTSYDVWDLSVFDLLALLHRLLECRGPYGDTPSVWLNDFNTCWDEHGLPHVLTQADRDQMLSALDDLERVLLQEPDRVDGALLERTITTIHEAQQALRGPTPEPAPTPSLAELVSLPIGGGA